MKIYTISESNASTVAKLMSNIKPDWWSFENAKAQLTDEKTLAKLIGWYLGEDKQHPKGWLLCAEFEAYSYLSIECLGFDDNGRFVMEEQLEDLLQKAEIYAREKGYRNLKYIIGSTQMSCHGRPILDFTEELKNLKSLNREHFDYFIKLGFVPTGFIPNCYGENYHGIIMIKSLL